MEAGFGIDFFGQLLNYVNMGAALFGVAATQFISYLLPTKEGQGPFSTTGWAARFVPLIAPVAATLATIFMEWRTVHPEIGGRGIVPNDIVRGVVSGFASEYMLRIWYKTVKGM